MCIVFLFVIFEGHNYVCFPLLCVNIFILSGNLEEAAVAATNCLIDGVCSSISLRFILITTVFLYCKKPSRNVYLVESVLTRDKDSICLWFPLQITN